MCVCVSWLITVANYRLQDEEKRRKGPLALESNRPAIIFGEYDDQCKEMFVMTVFCWRNMHQFSGQQFRVKRWLSA